MTRHIEPYRKPFSYKDENKTLKSANASLRAKIIKREAEIETLTDEVSELKVRILHMEHDLQLANRPFWQKLLDRG